MKKTSPRKALAYMALTSGARPDDKDAWLQAPGFKSNHVRIKAVGRHQNLKIICQHTDHSTYNRTNFFTKEGYRSVLERAQKEKLPIIFGDLFGLTRNLVFETAFESLMELRRSGIECFDARRFKLFSELSESDWQLLHKGRCMHRQFLSVPIICGLLRSSKHRKHLSYARENSSIYRQLDANRYARRISSVISEIQPGLDESRRNNYTAIASALNDREIPTKRGKKWRAESVKRILNRVSQTETSN